ncbi:MAG TPA: NYN domain-containing protein, partial [Planctomycetota bacterium]|nr:NYN domain-containing protein [Planctomycetota bacterium]
MFLIDGYNLLHALSPGRATPEARAQLVHRIEAHCRAGGYRARVVFDATGAMKRRETRGPVELRSVAQGRTADEEILDSLTRTADRTKYTVVSDDGAIVKEARKRGFEVL